MNSQIIEYHNNTQTINLTFKRIKYLLPLCATILSIISVVVSASTIGKSWHIIFLSIYVCFMGICSLFLDVYKFLQEYAIILDFTRKRAPINMLAKPNLTIETYMTSIITLGSIIAIIITALAPTYELDSNKFLLGMVILNIISSLGGIVVLVCCFPCIFKYLGNETLSTNANPHMFEHVIETVVNTGINHLIEEVDNIGNVDNDECCICMGNKPNAQIMMCEHNSFCSECVKYIKECSMCRGEIESIKILPGKVQICDDDSDKGDDSNKVNNDLNEELSIPSNSGFVCNMV